ncbi:MAG: hypothetical protein NZ455_01415 [Bacteroidia bacterium]|nr:hypothetical protein [Bacteroidia bacterium]
MGVSLRCASGRATTHYADASVLRTALRHAPYPSRSSVLMFYLIFMHTFALPCWMFIIN